MDKHSHLLESYGWSPVKKAAKLVIKVQPSTTPKLTKAEVYYNLVKECVFGGTYDVQPGMQMLSSRKLDSLLSGKDQYQVVVFLKRLCTEHNDAWLKIQECGESADGLGNWYSLAKDYISLGSAIGPILVAKCGIHQASQRCHAPPPQRCHTPRQRCHTEVSPRPRQDCQRDLWRGVATEVAGVTEVSLIRGGKTRFPLENRQNS